MNMNRAFFLPKEMAKPQWKVIDAKGAIVGRLATKIATILRGKDEVFYTPHTDCGDYVVIINAKDIVLTGNKYEQKIYFFHTGYRGNRKELTARQMHEKDPARLLELAVKRMMPKNRLSRELLRKLKIYGGSEHPHTAQVNTKAK